MELSEGFVPLNVSRLSVPKTIDAVQNAFAFTMLRDLHLSPGANSFLHTKSFEDTCRLSAYLRFATVMEEFVKRRRKTSYAERKALLEKNPLAENRFYKEIPWTREESRSWYADDEEAMEVDGDEFAPARKRRRLTKHGKERLRLIQSAPDTALLLETLVSDDSTAEKVVVNGFRFWFLIFRRQYTMNIEPDCLNQFSTCCDLYRLPDSARRSWRESMKSFSRADVVEKLASWTRIGRGSTQPLDQLFVSYLRSDPGPLGLGDWRSNADPVRLFDPGHFCYYYVANGCTPFHRRQMRSSCLLSSAHRMQFADPAFVQWLTVDEPISLPSIMCSMLPDSQLRVMTEMIVCHSIERALDQVPRLLSRASSSASISDDGGWSDEMNLRGVGRLDPYEDPRDLLPESHLYAETSRETLGNERARSLLQAQPDRMRDARYLDVSRIREYIRSNDRALEDRFAPTPYGQLRHFAHVFNGAMMHLLLDSCKNSTLYNVVGRFLRRNFQTAGLKRFLMQCCDPGSQTHSHAAKCLLEASKALFAQEPVARADSWRLPAPVDDVESELSLIDRAYLWFRTELRVKCYQVRYLDLLWVIRNGSYTAYTMHAEEEVLFWLLLASARGGIGKTRLARLLHKLMVNGTVMVKSDASEKWMFAGEGFVSLADVLILNDEVSADDLGLGHDGNASGRQSKLKEAATSGFIVNWYHHIDPATNCRSMKQTTTLTQFAQVATTNLPLGEMEEATQRRWLRPTLDVNLDGPESNPSDAQNARRLVDDNEALSIEHVFRSDNHLTQCLVFYVEKLIGTSVISEVSSEMSTVVWMLFERQMRAGSMVTMNNTEKERLFSWTRELCIIDAVYSVFRAPGAPFYNARIDFSDLRVVRFLERLLFVQVRHVVQAIMCWAPQLANGKAKRVLYALRAYWERNKDRESAADCFVVSSMRRKNDDDLSQLASVSDGGADRFNKIYFRGFESHNRKLARALIDIMSELPDRFKMSSDEVNETLLWIAQTCRFTRTKQVSFHVEHGRRSYPIETNDTPIPNPRPGQEVGGASKSKESFWIDIEFLEHAPTAEEFSRHCTGYDYAVVEDALRSALGGKRFQPAQTFLGGPLLESGSGDDGVVCRDHRHTVFRVPGGEDEPDTPLLELPTPAPESGSIMERLGISENTRNVRCARNITIEQELDVYASQCHMKKLFQSPDDAGLWEPRVVNNGGDFMSFHAPQRTREPCDESNDLTDNDESRVSREPNAGVVQNVSWLGLGYDELLEYFRRHDDNRALVEMLQSTATAVEHVERVNWRAGIEDKLVAPEFFGDLAESPQMFELQLRTCKLTRLADMDRETARKHCLLLPHSSQQLGAEELSMHNQSVFTCAAFTGRFWEAILRERASDPHSVDL